MRQTLIEIPLRGDWVITESLTLPGFGLFGIPMLIWVILGVVWLLGNRAELHGIADIWPVILFWLFVAAIIATLPRWSPMQSVPIFGYGFMLFVGFTVSGWWAARRATRVGIAGETIWDLAFWLFLSGILGARLFFVIQYRAQVFANQEGVEILTTIFNLRDGGLVLYGGIILAMITYSVFCYRKKINPLLLADVIIPSAFICLGFGRLGCFLNGCCYGDVCDLPWAVSFPSESVPWVALLNRGYISMDAAYTLPLHPTQLYSSLNGFILAAVCSAYFWYRPRNGSVLALALLVYPITRFVIEYLRADEFGKWGTSLTISQIVSIVIFAVGVLFLYSLNRQQSPIHKAENAGTSTAAS